MQIHYFRSKKRPLATARWGLTTRLANSGVLNHGLQIRLWECVSHNIRTWW